MSLKPTNQDSDSSSKLIQSEKMIDSLNHGDEDDEPQSEAAQPGATDKKRSLDIVWRNVALFSFLHIGAAYGLYLSLGHVKIYTILWAISLHFAGGFGITCGAHRLWAHRSYKASNAYKALLVLFQTIAGQNDVIEWARDHRLHHKYSETDADPHNANRGLFFSHMGWLMVRKHPDVKTKGKNIDISDLKADPMLMFQRTYYVPIVISICFIMPSVVPLLWGESAFKAYFVAGLLRYCITLHFTWTVNSLAHTFGYQPYDRFINPRENFASIMMTLGEGWHNYHHTFPFDYRTSEWGLRGMNVSTKFIDAFAGLGWVWDRKTVSKEMILKKMERSGDACGRWWNMRN